MGVPAAVHCVGGCLCTWGCCCGTSGCSSMAQCLLLSQARVPNCSGAAGVQVPAWVEEGQEVSSCCSAGMAATAGEASASSGRGSPDGAMANCSCSCAGSAAQGRAGMSCGCAALADRASCCCCCCRAGWPRLDGGQPRSAALARTICCSMRRPPGMLGLAVAVRLMPRAGLFLIVLRGMSCSVGWSGTADRAPDSCADSPRSDLIGRRPVGQAFCGWCCAVAGMLVGGVGTPPADRQLLPEQTGVGWLVAGRAELALCASCACWSTRAASLIVSTGLPCMRQSLLANESMLTCASAAHSLHTQ